MMRRGLRPVFHHRTRRCDWQGASGEWYSHSILTLEDARHFSGPAVYNLARHTPDDGWESLYIGSAEDLAAHFASRGAWARAVVLGADAVHVYLGAESETELADAETDLVRGQSPNLNARYDDRDEPCEVVG